MRRLARAKELYPVRVHGLCVMPNHFHLLVQPQEERALSAFAQWVTARYACDLRSLTGTVGEGHIFQSRFWNDGIFDAYHFLRVLRYIEANPVKAGLVDRAEEWPWSSLVLRGSESRVLDPLPLDLPADWSEVVNRSQPAEEVAQIEHPVKRGRPRIVKAPIENGNPRATLQTRAATQCGLHSIDSD